MTVADLLKEDATEVATEVEAEAVETEDHPIGVIGIEAATDLSKAGENVVEILAKGLVVNHLVIVLKRVQTKDLKEDQTKDLKKIHLKTQENLIEAAEQEDQAKKDGNIP